MATPPWLASCCNHLLTSIPWHRIQGQYRLWIGYKYQGKTMGKSRNRGKTVGKRRNLSPAYRYPPRTCGYDLHWVEASLQIGMWMFINHFMWFNQASDVYICLPNHFMEYSDGDSWDMTNNMGWYGLDAVFQKCVTWAILFRKWWWWWWWWWWPPIGFSGTIFAEESTVFLGKSWS